MNADPPQAPPNRQCKNTAAPQTIWPAVGQTYGAPRSATVGDVHAHNRGASTITQTTVIQPRFAVQ